MTESRHVKAVDIAIDLSNPRTVPQQNEQMALETMVSINPTKFWGLMKSIVEDGYHPTENLILILDEKGNLCVREGNRRVAVLKVLQGVLQYNDIPSDINELIELNINNEWKEQNASVPCVVYDKSEADTVDRLVSLVHAKGEPAGRDGWTAVAKYRYERDKKNISSPVLDLLEAYLVKGKNLSPQQAERWSGDYPITVLQEAMPKISRALNLAVADFVKAYPKKNKRILDSIMLNIGVNNIGFREIRDRLNFFGNKYGLYLPDAKPKKSQPYPATSVATDQCDTTGGKDSGRPNSSSNKPKAAALSDPVSVARKLRAFKPKGGKREKLVTLIGELKTLCISTYPHAFCFLLRSAFEISAKVYCAENQKTCNIQPVNKDGKDKTLVNILKEVTAYLTKNNADRGKVKELHGALAELAKKDGFLSVTSMNQLVHNPNFSVAPSDICLLFHNIFPLLEEMNS